MNCATCISEAVIRARPRGAGACAVRRFLRAGFAALALLLVARPAAAGEVDFLRGSLDTPFNSGSYSRWEGVNFGVALGLTSMDTDFGNSTSNEIAYILRNTEVEDQYSPSGWTTLPSNTTNGRQYGAFVGYNWQWDQLVAGLDVSYNRFTALSTSAGDVIARQVVTSPDNVNNALTITTASSLQLIDYATMRLRAGYAMGQFLPYAMIGAAAGRFNYTSSATVHNVGTPPAGSPITPFDTTDTQSNNKNNAIVGGFVVGLGLDVALLPNLFLRGEWEYVGFAQLNGIRPGINTGRLGLGLKF